MQHVQMSEETFDVDSIPRSDASHCHWEYKTEHALTRHTNRELRQALTFLCPICNKSFTKRHNYPILGQDSQPSNACCCRFGSSNALHKHDARRKAHREMERMSPADISAFCIGPSEGRGAWKQTLTDLPRSVAGIVERSHIYRGSS